MTRAEQLAALEEATFPVSTYAEALMHFRRPFAPAAVKWKVQAEGGSWGLLVAYIDVRLVIERLNLVWPFWDKTADPMGQGAMRCHLILRDPVTLDVITRKTDVGLGGDIKSMESDSMKRTGVHLGIGVSIYALAQVHRKVGSARSELRTIKKRKKNKQTNQWSEVDVPIIDDETRGWLDEKYAAWLEAKGVALFGPVLDHGDEPDAAGLDMESPAAAAEETGGDEPAEAPVESYTPIKDDRMGELRTTAEGVFAQLRKAKPRAMTPATFAAKLLRASSSSHAAVEELIAELEAARDKAEAEKGAAT